MPNSYLINVALRNYCDKILYVLHRANHLPDQTQSVLNESILPLTIPLSCIYMLWNNKSLKLKIEKK